jgi:hypothetical protein
MNTKQCQVALILRKPDENLKTPCFFYGDHLEFPARVLGTESRAQQRKILGEFP